MQNPHFGSKIKMPKNMSKSILQIYSISVEKTALENTKYSRNETILKTDINGYMERIISFEKGHFWKVYCSCFDLRNLYAS